MFILPETNSKSTRKWMVGILSRVLKLALPIFRCKLLVLGSVYTWIFIPLQMCFIYNYTVITIFPKATWGEPYDEVICGGG